MKFDTWDHATKPGIRIIKTVTKNSTGVIRWIMNAHAKADCFIVINYLFPGRKGMYPPVHGIYGMHLVYLR